MEISALVVFLNLQLVLDSFLDSYLLNINKNIEKQNIEANNRQAVDIFTRPSSGSWATKIKNGGHTFVVIMSGRRPIPGVQIGGS